MYGGLASILNVEIKFLPAAINHVRQITIPYPSINCRV